GGEKGTACSQAVALHVSKTRPCPDFRAAPRGDVVCGYVVLRFHAKHIRGTIPCSPARLRWRTTPTAQFPPAASGLLSRTPRWTCRRRWHPRTGTTRL